jgi:hypothetical protein
MTHPTPTPHLHDTPHTCQHWPPPPPLQTLEELLSLRRQVDSLRSSQDEAQQQAELLKEETAGVRLDARDGLSSTVM